MNIPIFLASDENFVKYMSVTVSSIINNTNEKIMFFVLDGGIEDKSKNKFYKMLKGTQHSIEFIKMDLLYFNKFPKLRHFSINTYFRYLIPDLKPEFDKVLYIDTDMVVCGDVKEIYEKDLGTKGLGAVVYMDEECNPDLYRKYKKDLGIPESHGYFNAGLLLINCAYWRKNNIVHELFYKTNKLKDKICMPDQDILNIIFEEYLNLPPTYNIVVDLTADYKNFSEYISDINGCYVLHYTGGRGVRPWLKYKVPGYRQFWKYAKKTPFYNSLRDEVLNNELTRICSPATLKKMCQNIFSVKNENIRKSITFLGIKLKIKSKKLIQRQMQKDLNNRIDSQDSLIMDLRNDYEKKITELSEKIKYQNETILNQEQKFNDIKTDLLKNINKIEELEQINQSMISIFENYLREKHFSKIKNSIKHDKNGVITYSYNANENDIEYYIQDVRSAGNIGDYIQSCAALQFMEPVYKFIDRDLLSSYSDEPVNLIMNAWWYIWKKNYKFSNNINPLFVSFHLNNPSDVKEETLNYLRNNQPIGCRDYVTRDFLLKNGIEAYFSGCLTLTLRNSYKVEDCDKENIVYFVDYNLGNNPKIDDEIKNVLTKYDDCRIEHLEHFRDTSYSPKENVEYAKNLLQKYAKAKLVVTTRLHCALPCLALGTPVIFVIPKYDELRYKGLEELCNVVGYDIYGDFTIRINKDENSYVYNSKKYIKYADYLTAICSEFAKNKTEENFPVKL